MRIEHSALYCNDLEGMKAFFVKYFRAQPNDLYHNPRTNLQTYILAFPDGQERLELMTRPEVNGNNDDLYHTGYIHLAFAAGSPKAVKELTARLNDDGYPIVSGPRVTGDGYYESCVRGYEGILIEITV